MSPSPIIPVKHRDKLKVLLVLKGYSVISCGKGMKALDQQRRLYDFLYGVPPNKASHIELLVVKGLSDYACLHTEESYQDMSTDGKRIDIAGLKLKPELIADYSQPYYAGIHITVEDMKSPKRSGKVAHTAPKTLLNWARTAATEFCRADAYCSKWWDADAMSPTTSGDSVEDVRRRVLQAMWEYQQRKKPDAESDDEVDENNNIPNNEIDIVDTEGIVSDVDLEKKSSPAVLKTNDIVPVDWCWKGYLAWYLHGSMASKSKRLAIFEAGKYMFIE